MGIGDGGAFPDAVAGRAGDGAAAFWAHAQAAAGIDPGNRSAAGADGVNIEHRDAHGVAIDAGFGGEAGRLPGQGDVRRGPAHIESEGSIETAETRHFDRADDSAGRAGEDGADGVFTGFAGGKQSAVRLHNCYGVLRTALQLAEVAIHQRAGIGVDDGGGSPFEFAELGGDVAGGADVAGTREAFQQGAFMSVVGVRMQQADGDGFDAFELGA